MRHYNKIILAERRNICNFSPPSLSPFFFLLVVPFFSGTLLGGLKPPEPPPLGCAVAHNTTCGYPHSGVTSYQERLVAHAFET